jgi:hypothetical protein
VQSTELDVTNAGAACYIENASHGKDKTKMCGGQPVWRAGPGIERRRD